VANPHRRFRVPEGKLAGTARRAQPAKHPRVPFSCAQIPAFFTIHPLFHPQIASHFVIPAKAAAFAGMTSLTRVRLVTACVRKQPAIDLAGTGV
jgi:hypothetical protein